MTRARALGSAGLLLLLLAAFMAVLVASGATGGVDRAVLAALRLPGRPGTADFPAWAVTATRALTHGGDFPVRALLSLLVAGLLVARRHKRAAAALVVAVPGAALLVELAKAAVVRPRPDLVWRLATAHETSFPSGHAEGAMVTYPLIGLFVGTLVGGAAPRAGVAIGIVLALLIGCTRVILGVHWTSDVVAGWLIGGAVACLAAQAERPGR